MRAVLAGSVDSALAAASSPRAGGRVQFRAITLAPRDGVRVVQDRPPAPE